MPPPSFAPPKNSCFVDAVNGADTNPGTLQAPIRSLHRAQQLPCLTWVLREGTYFLESTVELRSGLAIQNYPAEQVWVSGGVLLPSGLKWTRRDPAEKDNVWVATLPGTFDVLGLNTYNGTSLPRMMTRARHPNKDPLSGTVETRWFQSNENVTWVKPRPWPAPARNVFLENPNTDKIHAGIDGAHWLYGVGGVCDRYSPPGGYLCSKNASGGGFGWDTMVPGAPLFPTGVQFPSSFFTDDKVPPPANWKKPQDAIVHTWTNGWCTTMWEVTSAGSLGPFSGQEEQSELVFGLGGQQTGRGFHADNKSAPIQGEQWRVENVIELLDQAEEFYFSKQDRKLFLFYNGTGSPSQQQWVVPVLKTIFSARGSQQKPIKNVSIRGIGFRDAAYDYMDEWGVPSGGDWALHRGGAVLFEGVEDVSVHQCQFRQLDGNALFLSGYTRTVQVHNNSFSYIGDSAVATWGDTEGETHLDLPYSVGIDGTGGNQPQRTSMVGNVVREIGFNERQSSAFGEFKSCQNYVAENIFFNMPRAAINVNDGFGGGTTIENNLLFNTCRESSDHGPFNSWDRQPFLTTVRNGTASLVPAYNVIAHNFIVSNYGAGFGVDNDDTSSYYLIYSNFFYLGGGVKCDYSGHEKRFYNNIMLAQGGGAACHHTCAYAKGYTDYCYNNTIVQAKKSTPGQLVDPFSIIWFCDPTNVSRVIPDYDNAMLPVIHSNRIFNADGKASVTCGYYGPDSRTRVPLETFMAAGLMQNTTVSKLPSDDTVISWAAEMLGLRILL
eukprot:CAMPEP_0175150124 /NCGR_PEP_ID=MMETSP0087-20121206/17670_1 /TAXON_ID=136419 /ORGANISM="Unknown Unknown, Strain D1" /LENGTH=775 /DNA_ID=CAMNT_0016435983 /DNA_START=250 /DNA_END=2577 /DNA_ORIENTATION=-